MRLYRASPDRLVKIGACGALVGLSVGFIVCILAQLLLVMLDRALAGALAAAVCGAFLCVGAFLAIMEI